MNFFSSYHVHRYDHAPVGGIAYAYRLIAQGGLYLLAVKSMEAVWFRFLKLVFALGLSRRQKTFLFENVPIKYFFSEYNQATWNERTVEIPIAMEWIIKFRGKKILEVGAVLKHYVKGSWDVLDKYEQGAGIINTDVVDLSLKKKYDLIISVSTLEHVGLDEEDINPKKGRVAVERLRNCLATNGALIATASVGYNHDWDTLMFGNKLDFDELKFMKRINALNEWKEVTKEEAQRCVYGWPFNNAQAIAIGIIRK